MSSVPPENEGAGAASQPSPSPSGDQTWRDEDAVGNQPPLQPAPQAPYGQQPSGAPAAQQPPQYGRPSPQQPHPGGQPHPDQQPAYGQPPSYGQPGQAPWGPGQPQSGQAQPPQPGQYPGGAGAPASYGPPQTYGQPSGAQGASPHGGAPHGQYAAPGGYQQGAYGTPGAGHGQPGSYGQPPQAQPPYGQPPYAGAQPAGAPASKPNMKLIAILGGGLLALLLVGALIANMFGGKPAAKPGATATTANAGSTTGATAPAAGGAASADEAVKGYMDAVAAGDAAKALSFSSGTPSDATLLTDAVLAASKQKHPITNIQVSEGASKYERTATFTVDGKQYTQGFFVTSGGGNTYTLQKPAVDVSLGQMPVNAVGLTVNGVEVKGQKFSLFPGVYDLGTKNANFTASSPTLAVQSKYDSLSSEVTAKLSATGDAAARKAAKDQIAKCQTLKVLKDDTCGFNFGSTVIGGGTADPKSLSCTPSGQNSIDTAELRPDYTDPRQVKGDISIKWSCSLKSTDGDPLTGSVSLFRFVADMSQSPIKVTFD